VAIDAKGGEKLLASPSGGVGGSMWTLRPCICILPFHAACISLCLTHLELFDLLILCPVDYYM
jgi:hypothetical protein